MMTRKVVDVFWKEKTTGRKYKQTARFAVESDQAIDTSCVRLREGVTYRVRYVTLDKLLREFVKLR